MVETYVRGLSGREDIDAFVGKKPVFEYSALKCKLTVSIFQ